MFITIGPYQATGSCSGLPETSKKRIPSSPACTATFAPESNKTSERLGGQGNAHTVWDNAQIKNHVHDRYTSATFYRVSSLRLHNLAPHPFYAGDSNVPGLLDVAHHSDLRSGVA